MSHSISKEVAGAELARLERSRDVALGTMLRCRVRFGEKRKSGARKLRGNAALAAGTLWSVRDLTKGIG